MKRSPLFQILLVAILAISSTNFLNAQDDKSKRASPPATATAEIGDLRINLDYSSPAVKGRKVLGNLIPNGKIWRLGANEATTFEVNQDVNVNGQKLAAGKYALFSIQDGGDWTFIFNAEANQWGAYKYDKDKDVLRVTAKPGTSDELVERMAFTINETGDGAAEVELSWEHVVVKFDVTPER